MTVRLLFSRYVVPGHRLIFVVATALLGVAGSYVSADPRNWTNWAFLIGAAMSMYGGDVCGEIESEARALRKPGSPIADQARIDALKHKRPRVLMPICAFGLALVIIGLLFGESTPAGGADSQSSRGRNQLDPSPSLVSPGPSPEPVARVKLGSGLGVDLLPSHLVARQSDPVKAQHSGQI